VDQKIKYCLYYNSAQDVTDKVEEFKIFLDYAPDVSDIKNIRQFVNHKQFQTKSFSVTLTKQIVFHSEHPDDGLVQLVRIFYDQNAKAVDLSILTGFITHWEFFHDSFFGPGPMTKLNGRVLNEQIYCLTSVEQFVVWLCTEKLKGISLDSAIGTESFSKFLKEFLCQIAQ